MSAIHPVRGGRRAFLTVALLVSAGAVVAVTAPGEHSDAAVGHHHAAAPVSEPARTTAREAAFHDAMRKLWEDHITWTRLAIVSFAGGLPDLQATETRLLRNQTDIGNAIRPYYGAAAGDRLTVLLKAHIGGAVALLQAAKAGDAGQVAGARTAWYRNGDEIADFLHAANARSWPQSEMRAMMRTHLDETLSEAQNRLAGRYAADVRDYEAIHRHILEMADMLSAGIVRQSPARFR
jgi:hypothetical protein